MNALTEPNGLLLQNGADEQRMLCELRDILGRQSLTPLFQPIADLKDGTIIGYEGLIRGPSDSALHSPMALFNVAKLNGLTPDLELACRNVHLKQFVKLDLPGKLFLNVSPDVLLRPRRDIEADLAALDIPHFDARKIVIELTERDATIDYGKLCGAADYYRARGLTIAIDDLGEGFSSLRLWSELRPDYVKIDMHFIQGIDLDPLKLQFVRSMLEIARQSGAAVIAEGIETRAELQVVRDIGIHFGQGYLLGRPSAMPSASLDRDAAAHFLKRPARSSSGAGTDAKRSPTVRQILRHVLTVERSTSANAVCELFMEKPDLQVIPVVEHGIPLGLINRHKMIDRFARPYQRELYGKKGCSPFLEPTPLTVDHRTSLQDLTHLIVESDPHHLANGFIITENDTYIGIGTGHDLIRELTSLQIKAARYANPLTQLPGNVPINEEIEERLDAQVDFVICYCDLDNFKAFNDLYGYRKGDEIIELTASILKSHVDNSIDFVGHIGGDDFIVIFASEDWEARCGRILDSFSSISRRFYRPEHLAQGGYIVGNRQGTQTFVNVVTLSIGAARIDCTVAVTSHQVAEAASSAKSEAKKRPGSTLFVERRALCGGASEEPFIGGLKIGI